MGKVLRHTLGASLNIRHNLSSFFFNDTATTEIYTLSLHDALPISIPTPSLLRQRAPECSSPREACGHGDRKSTRLNSSHANKSNAVFCLKKKMGKFMRHTLGASLNIRHKLSSRNRPKSLQLTSITS